MPQELDREKQMIRVPADQIELGMYVAQLDRPWVGTPFLFQGFLVSSPEDIQLLKSHCQHVFIDEAQSKCDIKVYHIVDQSNITKEPDPDNELDLIDFKQGYEKARKVHSETKKHIKTLLEDVRLGHSIASADTKVFVANLVDNIIDNNSAMIMFAHIKNRDEYTADHSLNVCILSIAFARHLDLAEEVINDIGMGALLHDIGKMAVPLDILQKPTKLTDHEFDLVKRHPQIGYERVIDKDSLPKITKEIILGHHERAGGHGYPAGLSKGEIPLATKIVSIIDVYDAITSDRVYHKGITPHDALRQLYSWAEGDFDMELVQAYISCLGIYPKGTLVELFSGEVAIVVAPCRTHKLRPTVILILDRDKEPYPFRKWVNLASPMWEVNNQPPPTITRVLPDGSFDINISAILAEEFARQE